MIKVFLDANILFAAAYSPMGGSALILELGEKRVINLYSSRLAVKEAEKNLRIKASEAQIDRFYQLLNEAKIVFVEVDRNKAKAKYKRLVEEKDAPILAAAIRSKSKFLITLDRKHLLTPKVQKTKLSLMIVTPGQFISAGRFR